MKLAGIKLRLLEMPFRLPLNHLLKAYRPNTFMLELITTEGVHGYGEWQARPAAAKMALEFLPQLYKREFTRLQDIAGLAIPPVALGKQEVCGFHAAVELALLDAFSRSQGISVLELLGGAKKTAITYSGVVPGISPWLRWPLLQGYRKLGVCEIKLHPGRHHHHLPRQIEAIRNQLGVKTVVRVDFKGGLNLRQAVAIGQQLAESGVAAMEQPLPVQAAESYVTLASRLGGSIAIILDESLADPVRAKALMAQGACSGINLKIGACGGVLKALQWRREARQHGLQVQLGAAFGETSVLSAAGWVFAALCADLSAHEGGYGTRLLKQDICNTPLMFGQDGLIHMDQLDSTGLGCRVSPARLQQQTRAVLYQQGGQ